MKCLFTNACLYPARESGYCEVHERVIAEAEKRMVGVPGPIIDSNRRKPWQEAQEKKFLFRGQKKLEVLNDRKEKINARKEAIRKLHRNGWPKRRLMQLFGLRAPELKAIVG